jgi:ketosteroid isomerase-like protein
MLEQERISIEAACQRLVVAYCHYVDHGEASRVADLFTQDGVWEAPDTTVAGNQSIREFFKVLEQDDTRMSRHICSNFQLNEISAAEAMGVVYVTLYRHHGEQGRSTSPLAGPTAVGEYRDHFVRTPDGWRIKHRVAIADFLPEGD